MINKTLKKMRGRRITEDSTTKQIWQCLNDILRPLMMTRNSLKMVNKGNVIEDPEEIAELFNEFFHEKPVKLAEKINPVTEDPLAKLKTKLQGRNLKFSFRTVSKQDVLKILKKLKKKKSHGFDGITSEILKIGAEALAEPLAFIINFSISTNKFPTRWKKAKVIPLHKKKDKRSVENYRPVSLLSVSGMILERVIGIQLEQHFEEN